MKSYNALVCLFVLVIFFPTSTWAIKNLCSDCGFQAKENETICSKCSKPLNKCLGCGFLNRVLADYCQKCFLPMAEMRILGSIASETRDELRLGESERAQLDRELQKLSFLIEKFPDKSEIYLYRQAKIFKRMNFSAKEAKAWEEYLAKFPQTSHKPEITLFLSEALRKWGYLFYQQGEKEKALEKFLGAAKTNPMNSEAWIWVGRLRNEKKELGLAGDAYLEALKANPGDKIAIHFLKSLKKVIPPELLKRPAEFFEKPIVQKSTEISIPQISPQTTVSGTQTPVVQASWTLPIVSTVSSASSPKKISPVVPIANPTIIPSGK
ncbi:tetratricopeptide repeat protein [bacterium]|nr:tetratricopeptide repeat protein [bacterium]